MNVKEINSGLNEYYTPHDWFHLLIETIKKDTINIDLATIKEDNLIDDFIYFLIQCPSTTEEWKAMRIGYTSIFDKGVDLGERAEKEKNHMRRIVPLLREELDLC